MPTEPRSLRPGRHALEEQGIRNINAAYWNLSAAQLLEQSIQRREGSLADGGSLVVRTGQFTGRSPKDKFIVRDEITNPHVDWGAVHPAGRESLLRPFFQKVAVVRAGHKVFAQFCSAAPAPGQRLRPLPE